MHTFIKLLQLILLLVQIPKILKAKRKNKMTLRRAGLKPFKKRSFIVLKKLYRFKSIGKSLFFNSTKNHHIGVKDKHKIGLFLYQFTSIFNNYSCTAIIISMDNKLPKFLLRKKNLAYYLKRWFFIKRELYIANELFSKTYIILAKDKFTVNSIFNLNIIKYFNNHNQLWVESDGYNLLIFHQNDMLYDGKRLDDMLVRAIEIKKMLGAGKYELRK